MHSSGLMNCAFLARRLSARLSGGETTVFGKPGRLPYRYAAFPHFRIAVLLLYRISVNPLFRQYSWQRLATIRNTVFLHFGISDDSLAREKRIGGNSGLDGGQNEKSDGSTIPFRTRDGGTPHRGPMLNQDPTALPSDSCRANTSRRLRLQPVLEAREKSTVTVKPSTTFGMAQWNAGATDACYRQWNGDARDPYT